MNVHVKLRGFLLDQFPEYDSNAGLIVDLPGGSTVQALLEYLNIDSPGNNVVIHNSRVLQAQEQLSENSRLSVFPIVHGG